MRSSSIACCLVSVLLTSDAASAFTAPLPGAANAVGRRGGRSAVVASSARSSDASSRSLSSSSSSEQRSCDRSAFLKTSFAAIASVATFAPAIAFAGDDAAGADDLSMPSVEERKASEVSRLPRHERGYRNAPCRLRVRASPRRTPEISTIASLIEVIEKSSLRSSRHELPGKGGHCIPVRVLRDCLKKHRASDAAGESAAAEFLPRFFFAWSVPLSQQRYIMYSSVVPYHRTSRYRPHMYSISSPLLALGQWKRTRTPWRRGCGSRPN
jgi:hypothetical protein